MAVEFNHEYVDVARAEFYKVYVDTETPEEFVGSEESYAGDRLRIYATDWDYETPNIFHSNEEFERWMNATMAYIYEGIEFAMPDLFKEGKQICIS